MKLISGNNKLNGTNQDDLFLGLAGNDQLSGGALRSGALRSGAGFTTATDPIHRIIYNTTTGDLFYDRAGAEVRGAGWPSGAGGKRFLRHHLTTIPPAIALSRWPAM